MHTALTLTAAAALLAGVAASAPAHAADTTLSVAVDAGGLSVAVSTASTTVTLAPGGGLATILPGAAVTGDLGSTEVKDTRGSSTGWTAYISATDFVSGTDKITIDNASVSVAALLNTSLPSACGILGTVSFPLSAQKLTAEPAQLAKCAGATASTVIGSSSAKWGSSVSLTIPSTAPSGTYTSTVTQSVQ